MYLDDLIDKETYKKDYKKFKNQLANLKPHNNDFINKDYSHLEKLLNSDYKNIYSKLSLSNKKKFWLSVIDKIYIEDAKIKEVTFL